jgi:hypothetical protein
MCELQQHLRSCINNGWKLKVMVQRLAEEEKLTLADEPQVDNLHLKDAEFLKTRLDVHSKPIPGEIKDAFVFSSSVSLKEHKSNALKIVCDICGKPLNNESLSRHMQRHTRPTPVICVKYRKYQNSMIITCDIPGCSYSNNASRLKKHKTKMHKTKVDTSNVHHLCRFCGREFTTAGGLSRHRLRHSAGRRGVFKCDHNNCEKLFRRANELKKHVTEGHVETFQCTECRKTFLCKSTLSKHKERHLEMRPFKCDVAACSFSSKTWSNLLVHKSKKHMMFPNTHASTATGESHQANYFSSGTCKDT